jgi:hypothetical protein
MSTRLSAIVKVCVAIALVAVLWELADVATLEYRKYAFVRELRRGQTIAEVQGILNSQGIRSSLERAAPTGWSGLGVARAWRVGTPCDDTIETYLDFYNGLLVDWYSSHGTDCM